MITKSTTWATPKYIRVCPVCGGFLPPYSSLCQGCEEWKENADNLRKAKARRKAFGDII